MFAKPFKSKLPAAARGACRARGTDASARGRTMSPAARSSRRRELCGRRCSGWAASGVPSGCSGRPRASSAPMSATPAATRRIPPTRKSAPAARATPKSCASSSIPRASLRRSAARVLGRTRSDAGHAAARRYRHAVPLGDLLLRRRAAHARRKRHATRISSDCALAGYGDITTEIAPAPEFYFAEDVSPAVPREESRTATAGTAARASPVRSGSRLRSRRYAVAQDAPSPS